MHLTTDWQEPSPGIVVITPGGPWLARVLGAALAAPGIYLLYQLVTPGEVTIAGWVLLPVFAAIFLVPGWIVMVGRKRTRLDVSRREATEEYAFIVYTRRKVTPIARDAHVLMRYEEGGKSDTSSTYMLHVYLDPAAPAPGKRAPAGLILLSLFGAKEKPAALAFANKVAALFGIDVQDRCVEGGEVTSAGVVVDRLEAGEADD